MRPLLLLSLLALGVNSHSIGYRTNLLAYAPARGEFPVQSELAQSYVRYLDNTGAERLLAFSYPDPLYGVRSTDQGSSLVRSNSLEQQQHHQLSSFRAWCEQRYNALRTELKRLRAEGKYPSANMLAQIEPLEKIIKTNAFESVPALSPEVQRARDEHMRIWNEARLEVLKAQVALPKAPQEAVQLKTNTETQLIKKTSEPTQLMQIYKVEPQPYLAVEAPKPVEETAEVLKAREEHLRIYNAALQQQTQPSLAGPQFQPQIQSQVQANFVKSTPMFNHGAQLAPQPVEETPEVKRAREEHLKEYQEATLRQSTEALTKSQQKQITNNQLFIKAAVPLPVESIKATIPTTNYSPQAPTTIKAHEQQIQFLLQDKLKAEDQVADIADKIRYEERDRDVKRQDEQDRLEELRLAALEAKREEQRILEERRMLEAERIALQQAEQQRRENERLEESKRLQLEQMELQQEQQSKPIYPIESNNFKLFAQQELRPVSPIVMPMEQPSSSFKIIVPQQPQAAQPQPQAQPQTIAQQQQVQNGFFLRIQSGQPSANLPQTPISDAYVLAEHAQNPFLTRYIQKPQPQAIVKTVATAPSATSANLPSSSIASSSSSTSSSSSLSELELATRAHFKAHEIALEQLRLANLKSPSVSPCNH